MNKKIIAMAAVLCLTMSSTVLARGYDHGRRHGDYRHTHYPRHHDTHHYRPHSRHHHDNRGLGIAIGLAGGLLLGSALLYSTQPSPPAVVPQTPYSPYPPRRVVPQSGTCLEDQVVRGEWQTNSYDGRRVWVPYAYPVTRRVQVPCQ